jgi:hypothetical protein
MEESNFQDKSRKIWNKIWISKFEIQNKVLDKEIFIFMNDHTKEWTFSPVFALTDLKQIFVL